MYILITYAWKNKVILFSFAICINILYVPHWPYVKRNNLCKKGSDTFYLHFLFSSLSLAIKSVCFTYISLLIIKVK